MAPSEAGSRIPRERGPSGRGLTDDSRVAVVGGGPAGAFFAITLLRGARALGVRPEVVLFERRGSLVPAAAGVPAIPAASSCGYCAGGLSPPLNDVLRGLDLALPPGVVQNRIRRITIQSRWKNVELLVPEGRQIVCVYRGSRPRARADRERNFDSFLLDAARREGARILTAEVTTLARAASGRPRVEFVPRGEPHEAARSLEFDFLAFAGGVNHVPGTSLDLLPLVRDLRGLIPGFVPPRVRRSLIFELDLGEPDPALEGELVFVLHGSRDLRVDMGSLMPKGRFVTVVLIGPDIDRPGAARHSRELVRAFLELPQMRRFLPRPLDPGAMGCMCSPSLVVGPARRPFGDGIAVIGDMVTSRLYKDGIHSAYQTAAALATALLGHGTTADDLRRGYAPTVRRLEEDQRAGRAVFACVSLGFRRPALSRITYQAVLTERRTRRAEDRVLERLLWQVASGDATYRDVLRAMFLPGTILRLAVGGGLVTLRNVLTEVFFGLRWSGIGRFPTGVTLEEREERVRRISHQLRLPLRSYPILRLYTIRVRAPALRVFRELERFGDRQRSILHPRWVDVHRSEGSANEPGSVVRYDLPIRLLSFGLVLETVVPGRSLVYRVRDGFARGGVLVFDLDPRGAGGTDLSVLVAFRVRGRGGFWRSASGVVLDRIFPIYVHDVLWNHALCALKSEIETRRETEAASAVG